MQKYGAVEELHFVNNHAFITFDKRASAEEAIKNSYSNLVVQGKNLFVVWAKKVEVDLDASAGAVLNMPDYSLVPAFDLNLKPTAAPPMPKLPPDRSADPGAAERPPGLADDREQALRLHLDQVRHLRRPQAEQENQPRELLILYYRCFSTN